MKKILLFLLINCSLLFAKDWEIIKLHDKFGDPTGEVTISKFSNDGGCGIQFLKYGNLYFARVVSSEHISSKKETTVFAKIDSINFPEKMAIVSPEGTMVSFVVDNNFLENLKKGKTLKIAIEKYNGTTILSRYNLDNFNKAIQEVHE